MELYMICAYYFVYVYTVHENIIGAPKIQNIFQYCIKLLILSKYRFLLLIWLSFFQHCDRKSCNFLLNFFAEISSWLLFCIAPNTVIVLTTLAIEIVDDLSHYIKGNSKNQQSPILLFPLRGKERRERAIFRRMTSVQEQSRKKSKEELIPNMKQRQLKAFKRGAIEKREQWYVTIHFAFCLH